MVLVDSDGDRAERTGAERGGKEPARNCSHKEKSAGPGRAHGSQERGAHRTSGQPERSVALPSPESLETKTIGKQPTIPTESSRREAKREGNNLVGIELRAVSVAICFWQT